MLLQITESTKFCKAGGSCPHLLNKRKMEPQEAQVEWTNRESVGVKPTPQPELLATELRTTERPLRADEQGPRHPSSTPGNPAAFSFTEGLGESRGRGVLPEEGREIFLPQVRPKQYLGHHFCRSCRPPSHIPRFREAVRPA